MKILLVDDDKSVGIIISRMANYLGHTVEATTDGQEAVYRYLAGILGDEEPFDLVILDLTLMGGVEGINTLHRLRKIDPAVRVIISSGIPGNIPKGFSMVLLKPYGLSEMKRVLDEIEMNN